MRDRNLNKNDKEKVATYGNGLETGTRREIVARVERPHSAEQGREHARSSAVSQSQEGDRADLSRLRIGDAVELAFSTSNADMEAFRRLSGDDNPLHLDPVFAAMCDFQKPIVYGALTIAQVSRLLGTKLPGHGCVWQSLTMHFRNPLFVGETARVIGTVLHVNADINVITIALSVQAGGRPIAEGRAQALLRGRHDASS